MLHLDECADPIPVESAAVPLHSVGDYAVVEESAMEPLQSATNSDGAIDVLTETSRT
jgi:hypothetical protein